MKSEDEPTLKEQIQRHHKQEQNRWYFKIGAGGLLVIALYVGFWHMISSPPQDNSTGKADLRLFEIASRLQALEMKTTKLKSELISKGFMKDGFLGKDEPVLDGPIPDIQRLSLLAELRKTQMPTLIAMKLELEVLISELAELHRSSNLKRVSNGGHPRFGGGGEHTEVKTIPPARNEPEHSDITRARSLLGSIAKCQQAINPPSGSDSMTFEQAQEQGQQRQIIEGLRPPVRVTK